ncbi:MAG TPA: hypothetical protein ENH91_05925 [Leeuwenhoekiella sp.]|nr:hypothetical protein [Leeuwenhoekiella sp.]
MGTDKEKLMKGVQTLAISLIFILLGPGLIYQAFSNQDHPFYIPVLIVGIICFIAAIYFGFKGISRIMKSIFGE